MLFHSPNFDSIMAALLGLVGTTKPLMWSTSGKTRVYQPNGPRECARRRAQALRNFQRWQSRNRARLGEDTTFFNPHTTLVQHLPNFGDML